jgi:hypothetical protein
VDPRIITGASAKQPPQERAPTDDA